LGNPNTSELFSSDICRIGHGAVVIDLKTCSVKYPVMTADNAAKLAASQIYQAMMPSEAVSNEPEWLNKVTFAAEGMEDRPAIKIVDNKWRYTAPPFIPNKRNMKFWAKFADAWYAMCMKAMTRALVGHQRTQKEDDLIHEYSSVDI